MQGAKCLAAPAATYCLYGASKGRVRRSLARRLRGVRTALITQQLLQNYLTETLSGRDALLRGAMAAFPVPGLSRIRLHYPEPG